MTNTEDHLAQPGGETKPKRRWRRANSTSGRRTIPVNLKLNFDEHEQLLNRANAMGMSLQRLMLEAALADPVASSESGTAVKRDLFALERHFASIAKTIRTAMTEGWETGEIDVEELDANFALMQQLSDRVEAVLKTLAVS